MIMFCDHELTEELDEIRKVMKRPKATYATVAGIGASSIARGAPRAAPRRR